jgi:hypothetical protein
LVKRTKSETIEEFEGIVDNVEFEEGEFETKEGKEKRKQYHITMKPKDETLLKDSKTGMFHEWISMSRKATDETVPEGSVADRFIQEVEILLPEAKGKELISEVFALLKGKSFLFKRKVLGKSFEGREAKQYWCPVKVLE